jgi:rod shape-determining protein MreC
MKPLFKRSSTSIWSFLFFVALSIYLMFLDHHQSAITKQLRNWLSIPVEPLRLFVVTPFNVAQNFTENLASQESLLKENEQLEKKQAALSIRLEKLQALEQENARLHALLNTMPQIDGRVSGAKIVSINLESSNQTSLILNKGSLDNVFVGQPVLDAHGLLGQIIRTDYFSSVVLLVTDLKSAIPVEVVRTGERGILMGAGSLDVLMLSNLPKTCDIAPGDLLVTSSLGGNFPAGYPVGTIQSVKDEPSEMFAQIRVSPVAHIEQDREVFLLWPNDNKPNSSLMPVSSKIKVPS